MNPIGFVLRKASSTIASLGVGAKKRAEFRARNRALILERKKAVKNSQLVKRGIAQVKKGKLISTDKGKVRVVQLKMAKENRVHGRALIKRQNDPRFRKTP
jgi:hypothetical protein